MKNIHTWMILLLAVAGLAGCKNTSTLTKCPDLAYHAAGHKQLWAKQATRHDDSRVHATKQQVLNEALASTVAPVASTGSVMPIKIVLPRALDNSLNSAAEFDEVNKVFDTYSNGHVQISKNAKGRTVFTATSFGEVMKLTKAISERPAAAASAAPRDGGGGGGFALAGGILGIIALVLALGPYVGYASFGLGILAIIFGAIGLRSARHGWAVAGIVLGVLAIVIGAALTGVYVVVLHILIGEKRDFIYDL